MTQMMTQMMTQIWVALCIYLHLSYLKFTSCKDRSIQQILKLLQMNLFDRRGLIPLIRGDKIEPPDIIHKNQMSAYRIGATHHHHPYDNEYPPHQVRLGSYRIGLHPVSNGEYQQFVDERAYENRRYWSRQGWQWRQTHQIRQPHYWLRLNAGGTPGPTDPVCGISYYEAEAYANWTQARLPHEYEWELACKKNLLQAVGKVWEWCANAFSPYQGFKPFPYAGYSQPYFDDNHYILKGGSYLTQAPIKRPSFRNYYQPDKRHQFAGVRLVFD